MNEKWKEFDYKKLISRMSHDFRVSLDNIIGLTDLARERSNDRLYMEYCLEKIDRSSKDMKDMLNDLLYVTSLEDGSLSLRIEEVSLSQIFADVVEDTKKISDSKRINFIYADDVSLCNRVMLDAQRVKKVLNCLLSNAVKFTPRFGRINFSLEQRPLGEDMVSLLFKVRDDGIGIADEIKEHIFEPFVQELQASRNTYGGAGLGLAMSKHIVGLMGGKLDFDSKKGEGSEFRLQLAVKRAEDQERLSDKDTKCCSSFAGKNILLADDNEINSEIMKRLLLRKGCTVEIAPNGQVALNKFMTNAPGTFDLILMDVRMPYMDGLSATRKIRASGKSDAQHIPIFAMTASSSTEDINRSLEAGMDAHLVKPVDTRELLNSLNMALGGNFSRQKNT